MTDAEWEELRRRLSASPFRRRFHLSEKDKEYVLRKGMDTVESHARDFIRLRLKPAFPPKDGKQTPMRGHPVFIAQHATGCCCRGCLKKWHHIPAGRELTDDECDYIVSVIMRWIGSEIEGYTASQPSLF